MLLCPGTGPFRVEGAEGAVLRLAHPDVRVRGEAFALLVSDQGASGVLEGACCSPDGGVRASAALALGNRGEPRGVLLEMASDPEAQVRSCALGALAHVGMDGARAKALAGLADPEIGVRRAALQACAKLGVAVPDAELERLESEGDGELGLIARIVRGHRLK